MLFLLPDFIKPLKTKETVHSATCPAYFWSDYCISFTGPPCLSSQRSGRPSP